MSFELARTQIMAAAEAARVAWVEYALEMQVDNTDIVDISTQKLPFVCVDVVYLDGYQTNLGLAPLHRSMGHIHLVAAQPENSGSLKALRLLDHFRPRLALQNFGLVRTRAAVRHRAYREKGWYCCPLLIPFWFDD